MALVQWALQSSSINFVNTTNPNSKFITWTLANLTLSQQFIVSITAVVLNSVVPNEANVVSMVSTFSRSSPGVVWAASGRLQTSVTNAPAVVIASPLVSLVWNLSALSHNQSAAMAVGEPVQLTATATLREFTARILLQVAVPAVVGNMALMECLVSVGSSINCSGTPVLSSSSGFVATDTSFLDMGICLNKFDNVQNASDNIVMVCVVTAQNVPSNLRGAILQPTTLLNFTNGAAQSLASLSSSTALTVVEPVVTVTVNSLTASKSVEDAGDLVSYWI